MTQYPPSFMMPSRAGTGSAVLAHQAYYTCNTWSIHVWLWNSYDTLLEAKES
jgi:hypothetical protein